MRNDNRHVLDVLKTELLFIQLGGYSLRSAAFSPEFVFEDSPTCVKGASREETPCAKCPLIRFVPPVRRSAPAACRYIQLNREGDTLDSLYRYANSRQIEDEVSNWLSGTITRMEREQATA